MTSLRIVSGSTMILLLLTQLGCPLEPDPESIEQCKIGEKVCISNTRTNECGLDGQWEGAKTFVCPSPAQCQVRDDTFVCM